MKWVLNKEVVGRKSREQGGGWQRVPPATPLQPTSYKALAHVSHPLSPCTHRSAQTSGLSFILLPRTVCALVFT